MNVRSLAVVVVACNDQPPTASSSVNNPFQLTTVYTLEDDGTGGEGTEYTSPLPPDRPRTSRTSARDAILTPRPRADHAPRGAEGDSRWRTDPGPAR